MAREITGIEEDLLKLNIANLIKKVPDNFLSESENDHFFEDNLEELKNNQIRYYSSILPIQVRQEIMFDSIWDIIDS